MVQGPSHGGCSKTTNAFTKQGNRLYCSKRRTKGPKIVDRTKMIETEHAILSYETIHESLALTTTLIRDSEQTYSLHISQRFVSHYHTFGYTIKTLRKHVSAYQTLEKRHFS